jgi:predicted nucleotidyltransferase
MDSRDVVFPMNLPIDHCRRLLREQLPLLRERWNVASLELFGSRIRDDARPDSDLDVLVSFHRPIGLLRLVELEQYLSDVVGLKVDLVLRDALKPRIGRRILAEAVPI